MNSGFDRAPISSMKKVPNTTCYRSIVDPHDVRRGDAVSKLRGLADYAELYGDEFHRIESVAETRSRTARVLDLKVAAVREALRHASDAEALQPERQRQQLLLTPRSASTWASASTICATRLAGRWLGWKSR